MKDILVISSNDSYIWSLFYNGKYYDKYDTIRQEQNDIISIFYEESYNEFASKMFKLFEYLKIIIICEDGFMTIYDRERGELNEK